MADYSGLRQHYADLQRKGGLVARASSKDTVDIHAMASWMDRDVDWLRHVVEYSFGCGCDFNYEDEEHCDIWKALREMVMAEQRLQEAKQKHDRATAANNAMTIGKQDL